MAGINRIWTDTLAKGSLHYHRNVFKTLEDYTEPISPKKLSILHHNIRSLTCHHDAYEALQLHKYFDIISLNETWLTPAIPDSFVSLDGYSIVRHDRVSNSKCRGGGAALFINNAINFTILQKPSSLLNAVCDSVWVKIQTAGKALIVASIYLPPDHNKSEFLSILNSTLASKLLSSHELVLLGDFNINWNSSSPAKVELKNVCESFGLSQRVCGLTHVSPAGNESLLDLCFVPQSMNVHRCSVLISDISDHYCAHVTLDTIASRIPRKLIETRSFKNFSKTNFYNDAKLIPFLSIANDAGLSVHQKIKRLEDCVETLLNLHAPRKRLRVREKKSQWLTTDLLALIRVKNRFHKKVSSTAATSSQIACFTKFKTHVKNQISKAKRKFYSSELSKSTQSFYKVLRTFTGKCKTYKPLHKIVLDEKEYSDPRDIANTLNNYFVSQSPTLSNPENDTPNQISGSCPNDFTFTTVDAEKIRLIILKLAPNKKGGLHQTPGFVYHLLCDLIAFPLSIIYNECVTTQTFPDSLKMAMVTPLHKKGSSLDPANYRPISLLPVLSKVFEKIMYTQLYDHLEGNSLLSSHQFGFRKYHSPEQMLQSLLQHWLKDLDNKKHISAVSIDIRKAFDTVNHTKLLSKLKGYSINDSAISLIKSYLSHRFQMTKIENVTSQPLLITNGVPQGSILGPLLFNIMVNDLIDKFPVHAFADDTILYTAAPSLQTSLDLITNTFEQVVKWYTKNGFLLNFAKTQLCIFSSKPIPSNTKIVLDNKEFPCQNSINLLGIQLDKSLTLNSHVNTTTSKASQLLFLMTKFRKYLTVSQAVDVYATIIRPKLEYCSSLLLNTSKINMSKLESVQNKAIRRILKAPRVFSVTDGRRILNLHTLKSRREYLFSKFVFKKFCKNQASRNLLNLYHSQPSHNRSLRSSCPIIKPSVNNTYGIRTFNQLVLSKLKDPTPPESHLSFELG